ncbi:hypothetical protein REPUB_Repub06bG0047600 [Reevesia pubescens]
MGISQGKEKQSVVHESHEHNLLHHYVENRSTKKRCDECNKEIYGVVYACEVCKFIRHGSCAEKWMPAEITHPSHSMHELKLQNDASDFLCEICFGNSRGARYHCGTCLIDVDLACVSSTQGDQVQIPEGRVRKRTRHFSHGLPLNLFKYRKTTQQYELDCNWCDKRLSGMSFGCFNGGPYGCKFFLHEACISKISKRLQHPFHPPHYLYVQYCERDYGFSCKACKRPIDAFMLTTYYACHVCRFYLHISCARLRPTLKHKCHKHDLTYFTRSTECFFIKSFNCNACGLDCNARKNKEGAFYRCVQCDFDIHFKCLPAPAVAKHRYHRHFLVLHHGITEDDSGQYYCDICETERNPKHHIYYCKKCTYIAHVECVLKEMQEIQFLLKDLEEEEKEKEKEKKMYFEKDEDAESSTSSEEEEEDEKVEMSEEEEENDKEETNEEEEEEEESEEEEFENKEGKHEKHEKEDKEKEEEDEEKMEEEEEEEEVLEENKENSDEGEQDDESENQDIDEKNEANEGAASTSINGTEDMSRHPLKTSEKPALQIDHFSHQHELNLFRLRKKYENGNCNACGQELHGTVYICTTCKFPFHYGLHKACTELPYELQHPLHSQHSLTLLSQFPHSETSFFLCDECRNFSSGFVYLCMDCQFKLYVKCAVLVAPKIESKEPKNREKETKLLHFKETKLLHFSHEHMLVLGNIADKSVSCLGCDLPILGPAYCCLDCLHTIHEYCLRMLPQEMQHPFHPQHPLIAFPENSGDTECHACKLKFRLGFAQRDFIRYGCLQCKLDFHFVCANSLRRVLKSDSHMHNLYYFGRDNQKFLERFGKFENVYFECSTCSEMCNGPFYRCVECAINFHLKCVPIPQKIKSKCHLHHLILKESFVEDESGEYYCDVCEEKRYPKDHVYYCEECHGLFVAHIECVLSMVSSCSSIISYK